MYTLRRITQEGVEHNSFLGKTYTVVDSRKSLETFKETGERFWERYPKHGIVSDEDQETHAFVTTDEGEIIPLYKNQQNFIMTSDGRTFSNLSFK